MVRSKRFRSFVEAGDAADAVLPLSHVTDAFTLRDVADQNQLTCTSGNEFGGEPLLYFFYGRPAFRANSSNPSTGLRSFAPVCFLLNPKMLDSATRIFPFDTGAFGAGRFSSSMHGRMSLEDFEVAANPETPSKLVKIFFGTNEAYFNARPLKHVICQPTDYEVESYHGLITDVQNNSYDDRISCIEVQMSQDVNLKGSVLAVILPSIFMDDPSIAHAISEWDCVAITYDLMERFKPNEYTQTLYQLTRDFLNSRSFI